MKEIKFVAILIFLFILWNLVILFGFWGGSPRGCFTRIDEIDKEIIRLGQENKTRKTEITEKDKAIAELKPIIQYEPKQISEHKKYKEKR